MTTSNSAAKLTPRLVTLGDSAWPEADIVRALEVAEGSIADAATALGVKRHILATAISRNEYLRNVHIDFLEAGIDAAQKIVFDAVKQGNLTAATFVLSTIGKDRGFSTKQELTLRKAERADDMSDDELTAIIRSSPELMKRLIEVDAEPVPGLIAPLGAKE